MPNSTIKKEHILGLIVLLLGILMIADGVLSLWTPVNTHDIILDFGRIVRMAAGIALIVSGGYIFWVNRD
jgi:hypothetical protein